MSNIIIEDETSRLKQFIWEELDDNFFLAVIFRSGHRYVVQRHFEQQLFDIKSPLIQNKWRQCLLEILSKCLLPNYITYDEVQLMHEIFSWHLNYGNNYIKLRENIDYIIDLEQLMDCFKSISIDNDNNSINMINTNTKNSFIIQPVTTLDAARKNIEMWKNLQENFSENYTDQTIDNRVKIKSTRTPSLTSTIPALLPITQSSSTTGWLQLDSKIVPFIKKHCDRLLPVEYLLKEHIISSSEDFSLHSLYIPIDSDDIQIFKTLFDQLSSSSSNIFLTNHSSLITLDHLIFRLKRLFFIRFLSLPTNNDYIDYHKIMSFNGGLITLINNPKQRIPFLYINKQIYIPQLNNLSSSSTFCMANKYELEYLRLISLYDYLSSDEINDYFMKFLSINNLTLIPMELYFEKKFLTILSLNDFHYHEYQRRSQQQKNLMYYNDQQQVSDGWWQPPPQSSSSSRQKRPLSHFKLQRPIFF